MFDAEDAGFNLFRGRIVTPQGIIDGMIYNLQPGRGGMTCLIFNPVQAKALRHLVAAAVKIKGEMRAYRWDLVEWDPHEEIFRALDTVWTEDTTRPTAPPMPAGHAVPWTDPLGRKWILFCDPFPMLRTPATYEGWKNPEKWKATDEEIRELAFIDFTTGDATEEIDKVITSVARRRALPPHPPPPRPPTSAEAMR